VKRGGPIKRKTELKRTPMQRGGKPLERGKGLKSMSAKRSTERSDPERKRVREAVFFRDGYRCQLAGVTDAGRCFGELTPHHKLKEGQGGAYTVENLVSLCAHHNDQLEADANLAALARRMGLVLRTTDRPSQGGTTSG
jgi:hypothetical protein